ncbi:bile acid:sodium symporter family protein [Anabaena subtropica]|uniref:Bile acid:sodium symporter family protein n=1 Tax=Anabaena subtropica FACHB-260 TaxID=2692884 RepID=A0ABR8CP38_9NOST|nr:bile acid:sodium symporter family protein [Anabaena subtropica]MBD2343932.1 bile acid:sodium symporter family protein [Anabaena subtropica FACHB-260]
MQANLFTNVILPLALAIIMLGMGLSLQLEDFKRVTKYPKAVSIGSATQLIILPIIGFLVAKIVPMQPEIAVGLIILSLCPGGPSSNMITYLANGDVALSVTLTVLSSIITIFTIPLFANLALQHFLGQTAAIALPIGSTMLQIFLITIVPIGLGMYIKRIFPETALRLEKVANRLAIAFLALIILLILIREWNRLPEFIVQVGVGVVILNILAMLTGLLITKLFKLNIPQQICVAIEVGIQNGTLAIAITAGLIKNEDMAIPAAIYSLFMYITGFAAIYYGRKLSATNCVSNNLAGKV